MNEIINQQREYFNTNETKNIDFRIVQLKKLKTALMANEISISNAMYDDFKKSSFDVYTNELALVYTHINGALHNIKKWSKIKRVNTNLVNLPGKSYIIPEPLGVCLIISTWNYPILLSFAPLVAAIAAGNTVILKPSELPAKTSKAIAKLINENFDPNYIKVIEGGVDVATKLLENKFDKIFFTGSTHVGKIIYQAAAKYLTPVTLELGGKSPAIITEDCNLEITAKRLAWAKFLNAGQTCIAPDYVFIHHSRKDEFLLLLKQEIIKEKYSFDNHNYVQIIDEKHFNRLVNLIEIDKVYFGGKFDLSQRLIEPTIMHNISFEDAIMDDEIFGPLLPIIAFENIDDAIAKVKEKPIPLACYIFTSNSKIRNKILNEISFGGGCVNDSVMHISNSNLPFGGVGESGIGSYHGANGFRTFSHFKSIFSKATWIELNLKYFPHSQFKLKLIKFLMGQ